MVCWFSFGVVGKPNARPKKYWVSNNRANHCRLRFDGHFTQSNQFFASIIKELKFAAPLKQSSYFILIFCSQTKHFVALIKYLLSFCRHLFLDIWLFRLFNLDENRPNVSNVRYHSLHFHQINFWDIFGMYYSLKYLLCHPIVSLSFSYNNLLLDQA